MKTQVFCIVIFFFFVTSCSRYTRIGSTRYPVGTASPNHVPESSKAIKHNTMLPLPDVVVHAKAISSISNTTVREVEYWHVKWQPVFHDLKSKPLPKDSFREMQHHVYPDSISPLDTGKVLSESSRLLHNANFSYTIGLIAGVITFASYLIWLEIIIGSLGSAFMPMAFSVITIGFYVFGITALVALAAWLITSMIFWHRYGKYTGLMKLYEETRKMYYRYIATIVLSCIAMSYNSLRPIVDLIKNWIK